VNNENDNDTLIGKWEIIESQFKHLPVHLALLHTGEVLGFGGSANEKEMEGKWYLPEIFTPNYSDHNQGIVQEISDVGIEGDLFCVGHAYLPDGKLFLAGGTYKYDGFFNLEMTFPPFSGLEQSYIFDPTDHSWTRLPNMKHGRWYPTCVMLQDGSIATFAGLTKWPPWLILNHHEICTKDGDQYVWKHMDGANKFLPLYPRIHLMPNGKLLYSGSYNTHMTFPFSLYGFNIGILKPGQKGWKKIPNPKNMHRQEGSSVLLPINPPYGKWNVMLMGGGDMVGNHITNKTEVIKFDSQSEKTPQFEEYRDMIHNRYYIYAVILPDQNILVVGGKGGHMGHHHGNEGCLDESTGNPKHTPDAVMDAEMFITKEEKWIKVARMSVDRLYHSNAILLQDGSVMTAGSNPSRKCFEKRIEIYKPPYFFKGKRPEIVNPPSEIKYGKPFEIETLNTNSIESVAIIRPSNTTHCLNPEQRYIGLEFEKNDHLLSVNMPENKSLAPPGYYMLFILNYEGIPNIAPFVLLS